MEVILLEDVKSLGKKGQIVKINDGYARNFVLPKKLGLEATPKNLNDLKLKKANEDKIAKEKLEAAKEFAKVLEESTVVVKIKSGEGGRTFGSVSSKEIAQEAKMIHIRDVAKQLGISEDDLEMYGKYKTKLTDELWEEVKDREDGKLILVTAINPTPAGEGKTTTSVGLGEAFGRMGKKAAIALREPSLGHALESKAEQQVADMHRLFRWKS